MPDYSTIHSIRNFKNLVRYLRTELDWPVDEDQADDLTFDYEPEELGLDPKHKVKLREIKQIRPLVDGQPWGIFWLDFEPKRLPVMVMRRIMGALASKQRARRNVRQASWNIRDLMFVSATGQGSERGISFAHFRETEDGQPQLRTFSWDVNESHLYYIKNLNLAALHWPRNPKDAETWRTQWASAFTSGHHETIRTSEALAARMAQLADATRHAVNEAFVYEKPNGPLHKLYESFKRVLIHDLSVDDFADMYAQTVTYGLFSARATRSGTFALENVVGLIPNTNPFLRDLLEECLKVSTGSYRRAQIDLDELGVGELAETLQNTDIEEVLRDWGRQKRGEDPVIHFYETFLRQYDAEKKAKRGVFYTPDPVVSFIVRSVDYLLRTEFGCKDGLATTLSDDGFNVQVLDPATGTGTFLKYVIEQIYNTFNEKYKRLSAAERKKKWNEYVPTQLLPRLYGFELMMAPYAVAHMKLGLTLKHTEYDFISEERLRVYLTNALQSVDEIPRTDTAFLAHEAEEANVVKTETPITVIVGNPPYSGESSNANRNADGSLNFIGRIHREYYFVEGKQLIERNSKWLQNDYVKFIRWAQWRVQQTGAGIVAMITDNSYLDSPTFRGMRHQLMQAFSEIYIFNLHGNSKKQEVAEDGHRDENVFDITQGVAICLFIQHHPQLSKKKAFYADLFGERVAKYESLLLEDLSKVGWETIEPQPPFFLFVPQERTLELEYLKGTRISEIMAVGNMGITTGKDRFASDVSPDVLIKRVKELANNRIADSFLRDEYDLSDSSSFSLQHVRQWAKSLKTTHEAVKRIAYRFADNRHVIYSSAVLARAREDISQHFLTELGNIGLVTFRAIRELPWQHISCTDTIIAKEYISSLDNCFVFPLYLYPSDELTLFADASAAGPGGRKPNLSTKFVADVEAQLGCTFVPDGTGDLKKTIGPEDIFYYIYAVFHSPTYRARYAEFLKMDFPRLPLTRNLELFRTLAVKGKELVGLHLLEQTPKPFSKFAGKGDNTVAPGYPKYEDDTVWINEEQGFKDVPEDVWEFQVGGYQVCHKWLKDRRGRELSAEDKAHYAKVVVALKETIRLMAEIDEAIPGWPME